MTTRHLILAAVRIFRFKAELWRKFCITGVNPRNVARQNWTVTVPPDRGGKGENFKKADEVSRSGTAETAHNAVTSGRGVAFLFIYFGNRDRQFRRSEKEIPNPAAKFPRRTVIIGRRVLNVGDRTRCKSKTNKPDQQLLFHRGCSQHLNNFFV